MKIKNIVVGMIHTNSYLIIDEETNESMIVDPGFNSEKLIEEIDKSNSNLKYILLTHGHFDHSYEAQIIKNHYGAKIICNNNTKEVINNSSYNQCMDFMHKELELDINDNDIILNDNDEYKLGNIKFKLLHTPGHTIDSSCYYFENEKVLLSGDSLFFESIGRTDLPGSNTESLYDSLEDKIMILPVDTRVLPGHGPETTIGHEQMYNEFI